jgi:putative DNA primase/helicase
VSDRPDWAIFDRPTGATGPADVPPRPYEDTDDSNARRLVDAHLDDLRYCPERRQWLTWTGSRWRWDYAGGVVEHARAVSHDLPTNNTERRKWRTVSLMQPRLNAMVALARSDPRMTAHAAALDRRADELNTPDGVIDLTTGTPRGPDPSALHTRSTTVAPDFHTEPVRWKEFLATTFAGQPELTLYVQRLLGLSLFGKVLEHLFPVCHGEGRNGKGVLLDVVQLLLGTGDEGYAAQAATELIIASRWKNHPTELARLNGVRFVITSEVEAGQRFAEARLKEITGGDTINARFMGKDYFDFVPTHTLWLRANDKPQVSAGGYALWQRIRLIPFSHIVPKEERIKDLAAKLVAAEGPAILGWLIAGAADYMAHGLAEPEAVTAATSEYERDQDTVARFVDTCCITGDPNAQHMAVGSSALYAHYTKWCGNEGETSVTQKAFTQALSSKFDVQSRHSRSGNLLMGIRYDDVDDGEPPLPGEPTDPEQLPWTGYPNTPPPPEEEEPDPWWNK